jgi:hypothetical protein
MAATRQAPAAADNVDPVYEWLDDGDSYLLRLNLPGARRKRASNFSAAADGHACTCVQTSKLC